MHQESAHIILTKQLYHDLYHGHSGKGLVLPERRWETIPMIMRHSCFRFFAYMYLSISKYFTINTLMYFAISELDIASHTPSDPTTTNSQLWSNLKNCICGTTLITYENKCVLSCILINRLYWIRHYVFTLCLPAYMRV